MTRSPVGHAPWTRSGWTTLIVILLLAAVVRGLDIWHPVDGRVRRSWRECDTAMIARNFHRGDMDILHPRIDWAGEEPGYVEMEFPFLPWSMAALYRLFGEREQIGYVLNYLVSCLSLLAFVCLARRFLDEWAALGACLFFALSPLAVEVCSTLQPDGMMLAFYLLAVHGFLRWQESGRRSHMLLAAFFTAVALLAKLSAIHIGFLFLFLLLRRYGLRVLKRPDTWVFGAIALVPALLWYGHALDLWRTYGNSLGLSSEYHWFGWDLLRLGIFRDIVLQEVTHVWMPVGVPVAALGLLRLRRNDGVVVALVWLLAIGVFFVAAARTVGEGWADYYHVIAVAPVALLFGAGLRQAEDLIGGRSWVRATVVVGLVSSVLFLTVAHLLPDPKLRLEGRLNWIVPAAVAAIAVVLWYRSRQGTLRPRPTLPRLGLAWVFAFLVLATVLLQSKKVHSGLYSTRMEPLYACAQAFIREIPPGTLVLTSGGAKFDEDGHPVDFAASYMLFWMDRKGFILPHEEHDVNSVARHAEAGVGFFVAERSVLRRVPGFEDRLRSVYPVAADCSDAILFDLR